ncbi:hypothetical protein J2851_003998 [Azospirillum rugosum]|uniref:Uncharacterized protein n=1 Tax=Azospirillum rugosum TaxID=416170 RepID=A0ABS4SNS4_9PROT|nr:hypothetical protein [Azospirillum rugosum]MDQ0527399.1 hypothetical protein [Azospirillum rugosum]
MQSYRQIYSLSEADADSIGSETVKTLQVLLAHALVSELYFMLPAGIGTV